MICIELIVLLQLGDQKGDILLTAYLPRLAAGCARWGTAATAEQRVVIASTVVSNVERKLVEVVDEIFLDSADHVVDWRDGG